MRDIIGGSLENGNLSISKGVVVINIFAAETSEKVGGPVTPEPTSKKRKYNNNI